MVDNFLWTLFISFLPQTNNMRKFMMSGFDRRSEGYLFHYRHSNFFRVYCLTVGNDSNAGEEEQKFCFVAGAYGISKE